MRLLWKVGVSVWLLDSLINAIKSNFLCFYCSLHHQFYLGNQVHMEVLLCF